ncbi:DUF4344 domain-containing metallopeptidase [Methylobacterium sp.]|uniref:DUF4344 domain-containing metallopeptidase n=1 Tax=Methylobacterium sp. TaxID=409 RepID=UPI0025D2E7EA|nr:DUF4344 domain-containing metallopeptidase [Methylobacterium sp.]MBY0256217.1 DUF4344 domain-containing metallopeptidase [Methylobacterium sp.]
MRSAVVRVASLALVVSALPVRADRLSGAGIQIVYQRPQQAETHAIYRDLKARRVLEGLRGIVRGVRLPHSLTLRLSVCGGEPNAWYAPETRTLTVCYEYVRDVADRASKIRSETGVTRRDAIFGPIAQVFLHELGHALYDLLDVPVLGREEDAADQFAALVLLELPPVQARRAIDGIAYLFRSQAAEETLDQAVLADDHSLTAQRLYNLLCLAYGADRGTFGYLVAGSALPKARAVQCGTEYDLAVYALQKLFRYHLRDGRMGRARIRRAFRWMF